MSANGRDPEPAPDEPVFTTLAIGEEGDPHPGPDLAFMPCPGGRPWELPGWPPAAGGGSGTTPDPDEPVFTTLAIGEEGDPHPASGTVALPNDPAGNGGTFTTLALGEEGDSASMPTTLATGEEGDSGPAPSPLAPGFAGNPWEGRVTTLALGEEGDSGLGFSEA